MKCLPCLLILLVPFIAVAEVVVPIASVKEHVNIRMSPDPSSEIVGRLYRGDSMPLVNRLGEWHEIDISGGATGFISAAWVNVLDEFPPVSEGLELTGDAVGELPIDTVAGEKGGLQAEVPEVSETDAPPMKVIEGEVEPEVETGEISNTEATSDDGLAETEEKPPE